MIAHSESIQKIGAALAKIAAEIENPHKTSENPHFRSKYADLAEIINTSRKVCAENGVAVVQSPGMDEGGRCTVETLLLHTSGEWIRGEAKTPVSKQDPQGIGSAITYLRRYSLAALLGIAQEDDDGNTASEKRDASGRSHSAPARQSTPTPNGTAPPCPSCGGDMWDNRADEKSAVNGGKRPDLKCKDKDCDTPIWLGTVRDDLKRAMEQALQAGILEDREIERTTAVVRSYKDEPAKLLAALDWIREKMLHTDPPTNGDLPLGDTPAREPSAQGEGR